MQLWLASRERAVKRMSRKAIQKCTQIKIKIIINAVACRVRFMCVLFIHFIVYDLTDVRKRRRESVSYRLMEIGTTMNVVINGA